MRKKTRATLDVAAVTAAWDAFFERELPVSKEDLKKNGWKSRDELIESGIKWRMIDAAVNNGSLERKSFRVKSAKLVVDKSFYRPKI